MFRATLFGFTCIGFLMVLVILAIATFLIFRSGEPGKTKLSGCAGCAIGLALVLVAGIGALGCTALVLTHGGSELLRHGPIKKLELQWDKRKEREREQKLDSRSPRPFADHPVRLHVELRDEQDVSDVTRWVRDHIEGDYALSVKNEDRPEGRTTVLDFGFPIAPKDMNEIESGLRDAFGDLPSGIRIEIQND